jgi:hypothetical protein
MRTRESGTRRERQKARRDHGRIRFRLDANPTRRSVAPWVVSQALDACYKREGLTFSRAQCLGLDGSHRISQTHKMQAIATTRPVCAIRPAAVQRTAAKAMRATAMTGKALRFNPLRCAAASSSPIDLPP